MTIRRSGLRRPLLVLALAGLLPLAAWPRPLNADLVAALSDHLVAITTGFSGTNILLFGTASGDGDVVVAVRGPHRREIVRRKGRTMGIWINEAEVAFDNVPAFYALAASRPLAEVLADDEAERHELGVDRIRLDVARQLAPAANDHTFRQALIRNKQNANLYSIEPAPVTFVGGTLFRADMYVPANAPVGTYSVGIYLVRGGQVVADQKTPLIVRKVGFEARLYDFAHRMAPLYGLLAIAVAAVAGWLANLIFRKD